MMSEFNFTSYNVSAPDCYRDGSERCFDRAEVTGSSPVRPTRCSICLTSRCYCVSTSLQFELRLLVFNFHIQNRKGHGNVPRNQN